MHKNTNIRYTVGRLIITFDDTKYQGYCVLLQNLKNIYPQNCKIVHKFLLLSICSSSTIFSQNILFKACFKNPQNFISSKISRPTILATVFISLELII